VTAPVNLAPAEPLQELAEHTLFRDPDAAPQLTAMAQHALAEGVRCKQGGGLADAYLYYRFALLATFRLGLFDGLYAASANVFVLRSFLRDIVVRGNVTEHDLGIDAGEESLRTVRASIEDTLRRMQEDARYLLPVVESSESAGILQVAHAAQHLATFAGDRLTRRRWQATTCRLAVAPGGEEEALVSTLEELEQSSEIEACGLSVNQDIDQEQQAFELVWQSYEAHRGVLDGAVRLPELAGLLDAAFRHFEHLRFIVTTNGGPMAHSFSFGLSQRIQALGRDLMRLHLLRRGDARASLEIAERVKARSLGDLMSRQHFVSFDRMPAWFRNKLINASGNVQSIEPANLREVALSVYNSGSALIVFVKAAPQFLVWGILPDGDLKAWTLDDPKAELAGFIDALPYIAEVHDLGTGRLLTSQLADVDPSGDSEKLDHFLHALWERLIPAEFEASLAGCTRLTIVPDAELEYIPFAALRMRDGRYVVEAFETLYWPSVTAALATESDYAARVGLLSTDSVPYYRGGDLMIARPNLIMGQQGQRERVYCNRNVVLGDPDLTYHNDQLAGDSGKVKPLAGAREEAKLVAAHLGTPADLDKAATLVTLRSQAHDVPVVHIAAHGFADPTNPANSFLILADGHLSAQMLYTSGFGFGATTCQAGLVVLSACQTGRGLLHPDSVINLANGFLIAGANAVVATLWSIDDKSSLRLIDKFYELLGANEGGKSNFSVAGALRAAQLERLRDADDSHPFFWAAFRLTGSARNPLAA
jgi:CHAT domain-containing protein